MDRNQQAHPELSDVGVHFEIIVGPRLRIEAWTFAVTGNRSRTALWRKVKAECFLAPIKLGGMAVRWKRGEVEAWIAGEPRQTYRR